MTFYDKTTALIVVDVQNDLANPSGSLYVKGGEKIIAIINEQIDSATTTGSSVIYTQDWHPKHTPHFVTDGGIWPSHCVKDTFGAQFHPDLKIIPGAPIVRKGVSGEDGYSGFTVRDAKSGAKRKTELHGLLRAQGVKKVVTCGLTSDYCVKQTAIDAAKLGYNTFIMLDAVAALNLNKGDEEKAYSEMLSAGVALKHSSALS